MQLNKAQLKALDAAHNKRGFAYWLEMGLGKTLLTCIEYLTLFAEKRVTRAIVVCPNSFKSGWQSEIKKFGLNIDSFVYESGTNLVPHWMKKNPAVPKMLIVNYEAIRGANTIKIISEYKSGHTVYLVWDEAINLKGHNTQQTKAAIELAKTCSVCRALTGKPITQGPHDLWGQMRAIRELDGTNFYSWRGAFCKMGGFMGKTVVGAQNQDIMAERLNKFVFRATKEEYLDLPPKSYTTREYDLGPILTKHYEDMHHDFIAWLGDEKYVTVDAAITKYIKLAQIQAGFIIDEGGMIHPLVSTENNPRLNIVREIALNELSSKVVICYHHRYAGKILHSALAELNPAVLGGNMKPDDIERNKLAFNSDPKCRAILVQITMGRYGHTLLGGPLDVPGNRCSTMIMFENTYSLNDRSQIEDRIHRIGQTNAALYVDIAGTPLDKKVTRALQRKEEVFQVFMDHLKEVKRSSA